MFGFKRWAEKRRLEREDTERRNGYDFAAGRLLRKASTVESLMDESDAMCWAGPFDKGVSEAIRDWERVTGGQHG